MRSSTRLGTPLLLFLHSLVALSVGASTPSQNGASINPPNPNKQPPSPPAVNTTATCLSSLPCKHNCTSTPHANVCQASINAICTSIESLRLRALNPLVVAENSANRTGDTLLLYATSDADRATGNITNAIPDPENDCLALALLAPSATLPVLPFGSDCLASFAAIQTSCGDADNTCQGGSVNFDLCGSPSANVTAENGPGLGSPPPANQSRSDGLRDGGNVGYMLGTPQMLGLESTRFGGKVDSNLYTHFSQDIVQGKLGEPQVVVWDPQTIELRVGPVG